MARKAKSARRASSRSPLAPNEHVTRYVSHVHQIRDDDLKILGLKWTAFELRAKINEQYLSVNCVERASLSLVPALAIIRRALAAKKMKASDAVLAIGNVQRIRDTFAHPPLRLTSEPTSNDATYGTIRVLPLVRRAALEKLASSTWCAWVRITQC
jgi:hypothetical protein